MADIHDKGPSRPQSFMGVHHLKLATADIPKAIDFYTSILPFEHVLHYDHKDENDTLYAAILSYATANLLLEVRKNSQQAAAQEGWDPITCM
jgi:catechol 2,3-dioxygenase-like lactoylglutathione lyase family enzyme